MDSRNASSRMFLAVFSALCSAMAMGCILGWSGSALNSLKKNGSVPIIRTVNETGTISTFKEDVKCETWISSCITLAALFGSIISGIFNKNFGRRRTLISINLTNIIGWACICFAKSFPMILIGRSITGFCAGIISATAPGYVSEVVTPRTRGFLGTCFQIMITIGLLYMITFSFLFEWNTISYVAVIPSILCCIGMLISTETPISLLKNGDKEGAEEALRSLRQENSDISTEMIELTERLSSNKDNVGDNNDYSNQSSNVASVYTSMLSMIKRKDVFHPIIIAMALMLFQQFSGINAVMFYLTDIFAGGTNGSGSLNPKVAALLVDVALVLGSIFSGLVMDRFGRKILLIVSGIGNFVTLLVMGFYYYNIDPKSSWIPVTCLMCFVIFFAIGFGPIPWMIVGEITPSEAMPLVSSLGSSTNWLCAFITTKYFDTLIHFFKKCGAYWFFSACSIISILYTIFFVPETKGRSLEEMQRHFMN